MSMRKYERAIIRHRCIERDGNAKAFSEEWKKYHDAKIKARVEQQKKNSEVTAIRTKPIQKKKRYYDNGKIMLNHMRMMKQLFANMKKQAAEKKSEKAD